MRRSNERAAFSAVLSVNLFVVLYSDEVDLDLTIAVNWYVTPGTRLVTLTSDVSLDTVLFSSLLGEGMMSIVSQLFPF